MVEHVRAGSESAFEALFDRHHRGVLGFCRHMLGSVEEAEDAVQHTFLSAYRELVGSDKHVLLRPWLYTIARNRCLTMLRTRRHVAACELEDPPTEHLAAEVERRHELRDLLRDVAGLPEDQRAALVLSEVGDMSHDEIAEVLGCRRDKVKALVFQARSSLIASRQARDTPCEEIRSQLANLRGGSLRRNELRRHVSECSGCREFREQVRAQRRDLALVLPVAPTVGLKSAVLGGAAVGGSTGVAAITGGSGAIATKVLLACALAGGGTVAVREVADADKPAKPAVTRTAPAPGGIGAPTELRGDSTPAVLPPATRDISAGGEPARGSKPGKAKRLGESKPGKGPKPGHGQNPKAGNGPKSGNGPAGGNGSNNGNGSNASNGTPPGQVSNPSNGASTNRASNGRGWGRGGSQEKPLQAAAPAKPPKAVKPATPPKAATPGKAPAPPKPAEPVVAGPPVAPVTPDKAQKPEK